MKNSIDTSSDNLGQEPYASTDRYITIAEAVELITKTIGALRIYVVEADITEAQNAVRAIVEQSKF